MSRNYFATTDETETYYLEEPTTADPKGIFVKVKLRLSWGERKKLDGAAFLNMRADQREAMANGQAVEGVEQEEIARTMTYGLNLSAPNFLKLACYILEWNLYGPNGRPMNLPRNIDEKARLMERLDETVGDEIAAFIDGVVERQQKALEAAKAKDEDGGTLNGTVLSAGSRVIDGRATEADEDPTRPPVGRGPSGGSRRA